ncbi:MAG TPA: ABC transporter ATP-binding protein [Bacteroidia bacterium]|nr:ABC transporter ATP-binding protein [Bacteroidia bacterium]
MKHLRVLHPFFLKYKWHLLSGILFVTLSSVFGTYQGVIVRKGTNRIIELLGSRTTTPSAEFIRYGLLIIGLALVSGLFMFLMRQTIIVMSRHIEYDQKNGIYAHYQDLDASFYKQHSTGDLMNRISEDVGKVRMYTGPAIMYLTNTVVTTITILVFMLNVNVKLSLLVFLPLPFLSFLIYKVSEVINRQSIRVQEEQSRLTALAQESFNAIRLIKAYAREPFFEEDMRKKSQNYRGLSIRLAMTEALFAPAMALMIGLSVLITVWYGGKMVISGEIEPGNVTEFILYVFRLTWPFASLGWVTSLIQRASASQERINEFLQVPSRIKNPDKSLYPVKGDIEFRKVSFTYPENQVQALREISFHLRAGESLGITGQIGSGKSSLVNLLTRQYDCSEGEILIDGKDIRRHNLRLLRKRMAVVTQEVYLFSDSIHNNIAFGREDAGSGPEQVSAAARQAGVYNNIMGFKDQFETMIGERGVMLSGGQKQRISIARAIIREPDILVFDDCLSAVDSETEAEILAHLKGLMKNRTSVIISHRISSIRDCDRIIFMKDGQITEMGSHDELLFLKKDYYKLHLLQQ